MEAEMSIISQDGPSVSQLSEEGEKYTEQAEMPTVYEEDEGTVTLRSDEDSSRPSGALSRIEEEKELLRKELDDIQVPGMPLITVPQEKFDEEEFPYSYKNNVAKEILVQAYAENFRRQYVQLYRDRKPLLLCPMNECGIEKFVCTTIRPTKLPFREMYNWDGASEFVSDYMNFVPLEPPTELPTRLLSPATFLKIQRGTCFEYSTLLCSLLIGVGYDAYVISGYATRETCYMDETRQDCPLLKKETTEKVERKQRPIHKYSVKPPRDLRSKFELDREAHKIVQERAEKAKREKEEAEREKEAERPPKDPLFGLRVHSWILVLSGKREVPESFFIEPLTGAAHPLNDEKYLGIESLWNHQNYWVNMQDCSDGVRKLSYDLGDCTLWEFIFPGSVDKPLYTLPQQDTFDDEDEDNKEDESEKHLDMPPSWTLPIDLSRLDFEMRCPQGKKTKLYRKAKLEKFAPYLMRDGLVTKLSVFRDRELIDLLKIREYFSNRGDQLQVRETDNTTGWVTEHFAPGRQSNLKRHNFQASAPGPESDRSMSFYHEARVDGLHKREETQTEMTEHFCDRPDGLYYRNVVFGKRVKKFGPADEAGAISRPIDKITERYKRNPDIPANEDVAERVFVINEDRILLTYHTESSKISASTREYNKPPHSDEKGGLIIMQQDTHSTFQVDPRAKSKKNVEIYQLLLSLLEFEETSKESVRRSENETRRILEERSREEASAVLELSPFDTLRNENARLTRQEIERKLMEERLRRQEMELDYLAPFLAQMGDPERLTKEQSFKLREDCLQDFKQRLIDKANLIQSRFEKETQELQKKQQWYQQNQISMSKEDEEEYLSYCSEAMFRIHILEEMLSRHKAQAPNKYMELEKKLRDDSRLSEYLNY